MLSTVMFGSESPVRMQSYPARLGKFERLVCTDRLARMQFSTGCYIFGRLCSTLSEHSAILQRASLSFRPAVVLLSVGYGMPDRLYTSPKRPATHVATASTHIGRLSKCQLAGVQLPTGFDILDRPFHSRPTMQFSTG